MLDYMLVLACDNIEIIAFETISTNLKKKREGYCLLVTSYILVVSVG